MFLFSYTKTGSNPNGSNNSSNNDDIVDTKSSSIVLYFSATSNTRKVAQQIQTNLKCDIIEIKPVIPYTSEDLNYSNNNCRANQEQNDDTARPEFTQINIDLSSYDTIYIGYPIWWGKMPKIMYTFLGTYDFKEKSIIPFCTSGGSSITTSVNEIKSLEPLADVNNGRRFFSNTSQSDVDAWLLSIVSK